MNNFIKQELDRGKSVVGVWSIIPNPTLSEIIATAGFDFQILDMEHGFFDMGSLESSIRSCESMSCSPLVRVGDLQQALVQKVLDLGAHGIVFPQVKNAKDCLTAVQACHFLPHGVRGFNPFTRANSYGFHDQSLLKRDLNSFPFTTVIIENVSARRSLDEILKVDHLDAIYIGAYDMSVALGKPGDMQNPELIEFIREIIKKVCDTGRYVGVMAKTTDEVKFFSKLGANIVVLGVDTLMIGQGLKTLRETLTTGIKK